MTERYQASVVSLQEDVEAGQKLIAAWESELQGLAGPTGQSDGSGSELQLQESIAAKEEEVHLLSSPCRMYFCSTFSS
jgi:hypothetical protein